MVKGALHFTNYGKQDAKWAWGHCSTKSLKLGIIMKFYCHQEYHIYLVKCCDVYYVVLAPKFDAATIQTWPLLIAHKWRLCPYFTIDCGLTHVQWLFKVWCLTKKKKNSIMI